MTLFIKLSECDKIQESGFLFVEGSKSGLLISPQIREGTKKLPQIFRIICSSTDNLNIKFCRSKQQFLEGGCLGQTFFHVPTIIKRYKQQINLDDEFLQDIELVDPKQNKVVGVLVFDITYDAASYFEGEFGVPTNKNMIVPKNSAVPDRFTLYKGKCATKNLFSIFDEAAEGQKLKFIESIYKDQS